jgi:hypothetical protein
MKLIIDWDEGEGRVEFSQRFLNQDAIFRLDVLKDWYESIQQEYAKAHAEFCKDYDSAQPFEPNV